MAFHLFNFSFSVSLLCFAFFIPSCLSFFDLFWFLLFLFSFFIVLSSLRLFHENNNIEYSIAKLFSSILCLFGVFCLVFSLKSLFLLFFADLQLCFCSTSKFWGKKHKLKNTNFWSKGGLQQNDFFMTCVLQNVKSYRFCPFFGQILVDVQKHYTKGYQHIFKSKTKKNYHFEGLLSGPNLLQHKKANLAQIITFHIFAHTFFKILLRPIYFIVFF